jgi:hypothetical protein
MTTLLEESAIELRPKYRAYLFDNSKNKLEKTMFQYNENIYVYI